MMRNFVRILSLALLVALLAVSLVSCGGPAKDPKDAEKALKKADYLVVLNDTDALLPDDVEATIFATTDEDCIMITYYKDKDAANDAWEDAKKEAKELEEEYENIVIKKSGKMIWIGTKQAVKDAK